jgi:hypothetical protein
MSYILVDEEGKVADFASNAGLQELEANGPEELQAFLDTGSLTAEEAAALADALRGDPTYSYIAELLDGIKGDIILSNGVAHESEYAEGNDDIHFYDNETPNEKRIDFAKAVGGTEANKRRKGHAEIRGGRSRGKSKR